MNKQDIVSIQKISKDHYRINYDNGLYDIATEQEAKRLSDKYGVEVK